MERSKAIDIINIYLADVSELGIRIERAETILIALEQYGIQHFGTAWEIEDGK